MHIWIRLSGTGRQRQGSIFWLEIFLETTLFYESLEGLINFLAFLVQKLRPKKAKKLGKSSEIPWDANSMCARRVIVQNVCHAWVILMTTHFLYLKIGVSAWIFKNFSSQVKEGYLRQPFVKFYNN